MPGVNINLEKGSNTGLQIQDLSPAGVLKQLVKRILSVPSLRRKAKKQMSCLPEYSNDVSVPNSETIYAWVDEFCATPHRRAGTLEGHQAEEWVVERFKELGLENVSRDPVPITVWTADDWSLTVDEEAISCFFTLNTGFTDSNGIAAPLVYVGRGRSKDFKRADVSGKIVVAEVPFPYLPLGTLTKLLGAAYTISDPDKSITLGTGQWLNFERLNFLGEFGEEPLKDTWDVYRDAKNNGAAGICLILRNQPSKYNTHYGPYDGRMKSMPALWIGKYDGIRLRELAKRGKNATLKLTGQTALGTMANVWGILPGQSDEVILITSHHDSPFKGAVEDGTGIAQVLAQAWVWSRVPKAQRQKTLVFVAAAGHFYGAQGGHTFARNHKEIMDRTKIVITLEHLAAKEVREKNGEYEETGKLAPSTLFTSHDPAIVASVMKALAKKPAKRTMVIPADIFGDLCPTDAVGYLDASNKPVVSWISCPYYLLDSEDTLDKVDKKELKPLAETVTEIVKNFMIADH